MAGDEPAVTVLLPVRNAAKTLEAAARSILGQSLTNLELLLVDDGSDDATPSVLTALECGDGRVRVLRPGRVGLIAALNAGIDAARAGLVARMDADDVAAPDRLARQLGAMQADPSLVLLGTGWRVIGPDGAVRRAVQPPADEAELRASMRRANALAHPTVMLRAGAVRAAGFYRPAFRQAEDYDLWLRLMERGRIGCLPDCLLDYREHPGQVSWSALEQRIHSELGAQAAARRREAGEADGGDGRVPLDRAALLAMGWDEAALSAAIVARALGAAKDARAAGHWQAMAHAARLGLRQNGLPARTRAHLLLLLARSAISGAA